MLRTYIAERYDASRYNNPCTHACHSFDKNINAYRPHDKEWLKERLLAQLKKAAGVR